MTNKRKIDETLTLAVNEKIAGNLTADKQIFLLQTWYRYMFKYIPYDTGSLASTHNIIQTQRVSNQAVEQIGRDGISADNSGIPDVVFGGKRVMLPAKIYFKVPYAHRLYNGTYMNFKKDMHPDACARWGEVSKHLHGAQIGKEFNSFLRR